MERLEDEAFGVDKLSDAELVNAYATGTVTGEDVMRRLLGKVGLANRATEVLQRRGGGELTDEAGQPVTAEKYLAVAGNHGAAKMAIINFLLVRPDHPEYAEYCGDLRSMIDHYLPADTARQD